LKEALSLYVLYADELFIENLIIDYILIIITAKLTGTPVKRWRAAIAAALGGIYAVAAVLSGADIISGTVFKLLIGMVMVIVAFGMGERFFKLCLIFMAVSAAFAGAVMASMIISGGSVTQLQYGNVTFGVLALSFSLCYCVFSLVFRKIVGHNVEGELTKITIENGGRKVTVTALIDTGNALYDPITGSPITVCDLDAISAVFDNSTLRILRDVKDPLEALDVLGSVKSSTKFYLVPYSAVGTRDGLMLAFRPDCISRDGKRIKGETIAISPENICAANGYSALGSAG
jgi:stage II sporulation protein GA (sporulation sigma-E factor processing peptidase)